jgi:hypothetical protein
MNGSVRCEKPGLKFVRLTEVNDWEGETWSFWLQYNGNEDDLRKLKEILEDQPETEDEDDEEDFGFTLDLEDLVSEHIVNALVKYSSDGYFSDHNKVVGLLILPEGLTADDLYKGKVRDFFNTEVPE